MLKFFFVTILSMNLDIISPKKKTAVAQRLSSFFQVVPNAPKPLVSVGYDDTSSEDDVEMEAGDGNHVVENNGGEEDDEMGGDDARDLPAAAALGGVRVDPAPAVDEPNFPSPVVHSHDRERKVRVKKESTGKRERGKGVRAQVLTAEAVVKSLKCDHLRVSAGKVYCILCCKALCDGVTLKTTTVKTHIGRSNAHKHNVKKWLHAKIKVTTVAQWSRPVEGEAGTAISNEIHDRRYQVVESHLAKGLPMALFDDEDYRASVQGTGLPLAGPRTMSDYIPRVLKAEKKRLQKWVAGLIKREHRVSGEYDGSCVMHDAFAFLLRGLDVSETKVEVNLVDLRFFGKPLNHQTLAGYLVDTTAEYLSTRDEMAAWVHDSPRPRPGRAGAAPTTGCHCGPAAHAGAAAPARPRTGRKTPPPSPCRRFAARPRTGRRCPRRKGQGQTKEGR